MRESDSPPMRETLQAFALGKLDASRRDEMEAYVEQHPECLDTIAAVPDDEVVRHLRGAKDVPAPPRQPSLVDLAIEAVVPVVAGCAGALAGGVEGGLVGVFVGQVAEKAINLFGAPIVRKWHLWLRGQSDAARSLAVAQLAAVPAEVVRSRAEALLVSEVPQASEADRRAAAEYLAAIPQVVRLSMLSDRRTLVASACGENETDLYAMLPASLPPYAAPCALPGTSYRLEELAGSGGFGAVYRATNADMQYLPLAIKFCLDRSLVAVLDRERENLERLIEAGGRSWSERVVRLYGYNLDHATPYLVYEYVPGGDLVTWLERRQAKTGKALTPAEVLELVTQVVEALAFAHSRGIVHRDLKPANVLMEDESSKVKLADFGIGGTASVMAARSQIGTGYMTALRPAEQASLFRGAGTPLYADPEQREGAAPHPRHDLHSLGVMWYQLLVGDVRREMRHGWERELERKHGVPAEQVALIGRCVGYVEDRPADAQQLLTVLRSQSQPTVAPVVQPATPASAPTRHRWQSELNPYVDLQPGSAELLASLINRGEYDPAEGEPTPREWRDALLRDLTKTATRTRYLAVRTDELREMDRRHVSKANLAVMYLSTVVFGLLCVGLLVFAFFPEWGDPMKPTWSGVLLALVMAILPIAFGIGGSMERQWLRAQETLGPLPVEWRLAVYYETAAQRRMSVDQRCAAFQRHARPRKST